MMQRNAHALVELTFAQTLFSTGKMYRQYLSVGQTYAPRHEGDVLSLLLPQSMLLGFAIELYLKAWLSQVGRSEEVLRRRYSHNLEMLYADATAAGLSSKDEYRALLDKIAPHHMDFGFRYMKTSEDYWLINFGQALQILDMLNDEVDAFVGASEAHGLSPGH